MATTRTISFTPTGLTSGLELLAIMCWPETGKRAEALVSFAAEVIHRGESFGTDAAANPIHPPDKIAVGLRRHGGFAGHARLQHWPSLGGVAFIENAESVVRDVRERLFVPNGGYRGVAEAPGMTAITRQVEHAIEHGALASALLVLAVARMSASNHVEARPSLGRAITLLEGVTLRVSTKVTPSGFGQERILKKHWKQWSPVAPLWAAAIISGGFAWPADGLSFDRHEMGERVFDALSDPLRLARLASYSNSLADLLTTLVPSGAARPLLASHSVFRLDTGMPAQAPPIPPLHASELALIRGHETATVKKSDLG